MDRTCDSGVDMQAFHFIGCSFLLFLFFSCMLGWLVGCGFAYSVSRLLVSFLWRYGMVSRQFVLQVGSVELEF
jgi:hypothetical protein